MESPSSLSGHDSRPSPSSGRPYSRGRREEPTRRRRECTLDSAPAAQRSPPDKETVAAGKPEGSAQKKSGSPPVNETPPGGEPGACALPHDLSRRHHPRAPRRGE